MVSKIYPAKLELNKANTSNTEASFLDLGKFCLSLMILFLPKIMINVKILIFKLSISLLGGNVPRSSSYRVYICQHIRFARASSHVAYLNIRKKLLTQYLLKQGYRYHKLCKTFFINLPPIL